MKKLVVPEFQDGGKIIEFGHALSSSEGVSLDFSSIGFARPSGMILLSEFVRPAVSEGRVADVIGAQPRSYPANMGFFESCGIDVEKNHAGGGENYLPIREIDLGQWRVDADDKGLNLGELANQRVGRMSYLISRQTRGDLFELVKYCLREIVRNALEHSEGDRMSLSGQYWPQLNEVELCIYDNGIGVKRGLNKNPRFSVITTDRDAIRLALLPSISGVRRYDMPEEIDNDQAGGRWGNSGFGLYITSQLAKGSGFFLIGSEESWRKVGKDGGLKGDLGLRGTYIAMRFNVAALQRTASRIDDIASRGEGFAKRHFSSGVEVLASAASKQILN